jgi:hypothetical protein
MKNARQKFMARSESLDNPRAFTLAARRTQISAVISLLEIFEICSTFCAILLIAGTAATSSSPERAGR